MPSLPQLLENAGVRQYFLAFFYWNDIFGTLPLISKATYQHLSGNDWSPTERQRYANRFLIQPPSDLL